MRELGRRTGEGWRAFRQARFFGIATKKDEATGKYSYGNEAGYHAMTADDFPNIKSINGNLWIKTEGETEYRLVQLGIQGWKAYTTYVEDQRPTRLSEYWIRSLRSSRTQQSQDTNAFCL